MSTPSSRGGTLAARVEHTMPSGKRRSIGFLAVVACLGGFLFGYDTGVISGALPYMYMPREAGGLGLSPLEEGLVGGLLLLGCAIGAVYGGRLSDQYGRRHNIALLAIVFFVGAVGCALAPNIWVLYLARLVLGLAVGGASATVPVYLSETAPKKLRGSLVAVDQLMIVTGQLTAFIVNASLAASRGGPRATVGEDPSGEFAAGSVQPWDLLAGITGLTVTDGNGSMWRWMLVLASLPAIALWVGIRMMPESARWHMARGELTAAISSLKRIRVEGKDDVTGEVREMVENLEREKEQPKWSLGQAFAVPWMRNVIVFGALLGLFQQFTGVNTMMYYAPKVLMAAGFSSQASIVLNVFTGVASVIGSAAGLLALRRFGRRQVLLVGQTVLTLALIAMTAVFLFGINPYLQPDGAVSPDIPTFVPYLVVVIIVLFMLGMQSGPGPVTWVMLSEIFPGKIRGVAMGFAVTVIWLANMTITFAFPVMMSGLGPITTYALFALINIGAIVFYVLKVPETSRYSLEELEVKFEHEGVKRF